MKMDIINNLFPTLIAKLATENLNIPESQIINIHEILGGEKLDKRNLFLDPVHPNDDGCKLMARIIYNYITRKE